MNVNEVIANLGNQLLEQKGKEERLHPNDDVNMSQSSNDTFPTALHVAGVLAVEDQLLPAIAVLKATFADKSDAFKDIIKIGRTHLQDATPITLGQEISGWEAMLGKSERMIRESVQYLKELAIGGTAVGTGINAHPDFGDFTAKEIGKHTGKDFVSAPNKFHALTSHDEVVYAHGAVKALAADLMKIANDVRWLASGPAVDWEKSVFRRMSQAAPLCQVKSTQLRARLLPWWLRRSWGMMQRLDSRRVRVILN